MAEPVEEFKQQCEREVSFNDSSCDSDSSSYVSSSSSSYSLDDKIINDDDIEGIDEDRLARQMMKMMKKHAGTVSKILMERAALIDSICWLGQHVPRCVLDDLFEDIYIISKHKEKEKRNSNLHHNGPHDRTDTTLTAETHQHRMDFNQNNTTNFNHGDDLDCQSKISDSNVQPTKSFIDPFADESDSDSHSPAVERSSPQPTSSSAFIDPFPYDSDDERERQKKLQENNASRPSNGDDASEMNVSNGSSSHPQKERYLQPQVRMSPMVLPYASYHTCALLFVDISGFTKLSQILDVENLSKVSSNICKNLCKKNFFFVLRKNIEHLLFVIFRFFHLCRRSIVILK